MPKITINLTDAENLALETVASSAKEWIDNAAHNRARKAVVRITAALMQHCNQNNIPLAVGAEAQVRQAIELGVVKTAAQAIAEAEAEAAAEAEAEELA